MSPGTKWEPAPSPFETEARFQFYSIMSWSSWCGVHTSIIPRVSMFNAVVTWWKLAGSMSWLQRMDLIHLTCPEENGCMKEHGHSAWSTAACPKSSQCSTPSIHHPFENELKAANNGPARSRRLFCSHSYSFKFLVHHSEPPAPWWKCCVKNTSGIYFSASISNIIQMRTIWKHFKLIM